MSNFFIGHERQVHYLNISRNKGTLSHAYLFYGPEHVGKLTIALRLAQSFFCSEVKKDDILSVCDVCFSCRAITEYKHPQVIVLDTMHTLVSKKEIRKEIPIEYIRELKRVLSFAPSANQWRLVIINEAENMSEEAANAFLKLLEEPGTQTLFILISPHKDLLLPTVVSRTQAIGFSIVSHHAMARMLDERSIVGDKQEEFLLCAGGRPGILITLCEDSAFLSEERLLLRDMHAASQKNDLVSLLHISEKISHDAILRSMAIYHIISDLRMRLTSDQFPNDVVKKIKRIDYISHMMDTTNVNPRLACDALFLEYVGS